MDYLKAFAVGGAICVIGQILIDKTKLTPARILVSFVCIGAFLSLIGVYKPLVEFAGAGATVPIVGFGHSLVEGVKKAVDKDGILGILKGVTAAVFFGFLAGIIFKPKAK